MFSERTAIVTGAGNGIGREIALDLARHGAHVVAVGRTIENLNLTAEIGSREGVDIAVRPCDVSSPSAVGALAAEFGKHAPTILVNNAGIAGPVKPLTEVGPAEWDETFAINVRSIYLMCRAFLPPMISLGFGDIINIASVSGKRPLPNRTPYCASKMAVIGLTSTLAWEVGDSGVKVNSLSPGPVDGPRIRNVVSAAAEQSGRTYDDVAAEFTNRTALRRMLTESEIAGGVRSILNTPGLTAADIDLSAGMVAR